MHKQWIPGLFLRFFEWAWVRGYINLSVSSVAKCQMILIHLFESQKINMLRLTRRIVNCFTTHECRPLSPAKSVPNLVCFCGQNVKYRRESSHCYHWQQPNVLMWNAIICFGISVVQDDCCASANYLHKCNWSTVLQCSSFNQYAIGVVHLKRHCFMMKVSLSFNFSSGLLDPIASVS